MPNGVAAEEPWLYGGNASFWLSAPGCQLLAPSSRQTQLPALSSSAPGPSNPGGLGAKDQGPRTKDHGPIQEWPHAEPLTLGQKQWENTAEAHNKLLIYGSAFGHKKHAVFIVFNQLEKIWQSL